MVGGAADKVCTPDVHACNGRLVLTPCIRLSPLRLVRCLWNKESIKACSPAMQIEDGH